MSLRLAMRVCSVHAFACAEAEHDWQQTCKVRGACVGITWGSRSHDTQVLHRWIISPFVSKCSLLWRCCYCLIVGRVSPWLHLWDYPWHPHCILEGVDRRTIHLMNWIAMLFWRWRADILIKSSVWSAIPNKGMDQKLVSAVLKSKTSSAFQSWEPEHSFLSHLATPENQTNEWICTDLPLFLCMPSSHFLSSLPLFQERASDPCFLLPLLCLVPAWNESVISKSKLCTPRSG